MNEIFLDIHVAVPPDEQVREILPAALSEIGFEGFAEDERGIHCYIKKDDWYGSIEHILKDLSDQLNLPFVELLGVTEIVNKNWNEEWEKSIQPIRVSDRIVIAPSWHHIDEQNTIVLTIDPKMTFGTGYHETTRIMLRMMEQYITAGSTVLDVGTGTGILAIAAVKFGSRNAIGVDIDKWTLDNGKENAVRNGVADKVSIRVGSLEMVTEHSFDIIIANIIRNTILELLDGIISKLAPDGTMLFSGLLASDRPIIEKALAERHFSVLSVQQENDWIGMAARRA